MKGMDGRPSRYLVSVAMSVLLAGVLLSPTTPHPVQGNTSPPIIAPLDSQEASYDSLSAAITAARYRMRPVEPTATAGLAQAFYTANPAQHFTAHFTPEAVELIRQPQSTMPGWHLRMELLFYGYDEQFVPLGSGILMVSGNRIDYQRTAAAQDAVAVTEWYANRPDGLEQGFTIHRPPLAHREGRPLQLRLGVRGNLLPALAADQKTIWLRQSNGELALSYGGLAAWDASGNQLRTRMLVVGAEVWLEVEDAGAAYPVTIDPTFVEQQKLVASDGAAGDSFGLIVADEGGTIVVTASGDDIGANVNQGSAYVFERLSGAWVEQQKLVASDGAAGDFFGSAAAINGGTIVVSAQEDDIGANSNQGSAYVFERLSGAWVEQQKLVASDGAAGDFFGFLVDIHGGTIVIGAPVDDIGTNADQGSAYVFERAGGAWVEQQKLVASDGAAGDLFGGAVAVHSGTIVIGAPFDDIGANVNQGSAYVFERAGGAWVEQQKLVASDGAAGDLFGGPVAAHSDTIVVGAEGDDIGANSNQGSAYVFELSGAWVEQQKLVASDGATGDRFGFYVAVHGSTIVIGARLDDIGANSNQGSAYVFERLSGAWVEQQKLVASDGATGDRFGFYVAVHGSTIVMGAPGDDIGANSDQGSAYVFGP